MPLKSIIFFYHSYMMKLWKVKHVIQINLYFQQFTYHLSSVIFLHQIPYMCIHGKYGIYLEIYIILIYIIHRWPLWHIIRWISFVFFFIILLLHNIKQIATTSLIKGYLEYFVNGNITEFWHSYSIVFPTALNSSHLYFMFSIEFCYWIGHSWLTCSLKLFCLPEILCSYFVHHLSKIRTLNHFLVQPQMFIRQKMKTNKIKSFNQKIIMELLQWTITR